MLHAGLWRCFADPTQVESAILNLCVNARDAMPAGGRLTIETNNSDLDERYAASQIEVTPGQYVAICVSDTGSGMPADVIERAFDPKLRKRPNGPNRTGARHLPPAAMVDRLVAGAPTLPLPQVRVEGGAARRRLLRACRPAAASASSTCCGRRDS